MSTLITSVIALEVLKITEVIGESLDRRIQSAFPSVGHFKITCAGQIAQVVAHNKLN